jgi:formylglycine-generating enzyme required for sulfatase activity
MSADTSARLNEILAMGPGPRLAPLVAFADELAAADDRDDAVVADTVGALVTLLNQCVGSGKGRLALGVALGKLGDPRLRAPADADYWVDVQLDDGSTLQVARFHVTTAEFQAWIDAGGYDDDQWWSEGGRAWRDSGAPGWSELAAKPDVAHLVVPNQPVAGPTYWEAEAYANAHGARIMDSDEHRWIMRGATKRPYPWGAPFGDGNANTREEALGGPCAVGLYRSDRTPEGVCDLAGNMGEWLGDEMDGKRKLHPGSWAQPSMAAWAKALELAAPDVRSGDMSFRLVRPAAG